MMSFEINDTEEQRASLRKLVDFATKMNEGQMATPKWWVDAAKECAKFLEYISFVSTLNGVNDK